MGAASDWTMPGSKGEAMHGSTHLPDSDVCGAVVLIHGFKGYKDYGMFPHLAATLADAGFITHRVSLSHSGMGHGHGSFDEALFEQDTWNRSVEDLCVLCSAIDKGHLAGDGRGIYLMGHSRGGAAVLTAAGRHATDGRLGALRGVVSLSAPARLMGLDEKTAESLLASGRLVSPSSRTNQELHVGVGWLREQLDDPEGHDLPTLMAGIKVPVLLVHGVDDPTVPVSNALRLAQCAPDHVQVHLVEAGDHVFNTANPFGVTASPSTQLADAEAAIVAFLVSQSTV